MYSISEISMVFLSLLKACISNTETSLEEWVRGGLEPPQRNLGDMKKDKKDKKTKNNLLINISPLDFKT